MLREERAKDHIKATNEVALIAKDSLEIGEEILGPWSTRAFNVEPYGGVRVTRFIEDIDFEDIEGVEVRYIRHAQGGLSPQGAIQEAEIVHADGGTFTLAIGAQTTGALAYAINAANMRTALEGLALGRQEVYASPEDTVNDEIPIYGQTRLAHRFIPSIPIPGDGHVDSLKAVLALAKTGDLADDLLISVVNDEQGQPGDTVLGTVAVAPGDLLGEVQIETVEVLTGASQDGILIMTVTAGVLGGGSETAEVAVTAGDTTAQVATKVQNALRDTPDIGNNFWVTATGAFVAITAREYAANDVTMSIDLTTDAPATGVTFGASTATTAGTGGARQLESTEMIINVESLDGTLYAALASEHWVGLRAMSVVIDAGDTTAQVAAKVAARLEEDPVMDEHYTFEAQTVYVLTRARVHAADDDTLDLTLDDDGGTGVTFAATVQITAGVAPVQQVESITVTNECTQNGVFVVTVTAAGMTGTPHDTVVWVDTDDNTVALVAEKMREALAADSTITDFFTVSRDVATIHLEALAADSNDATMDIGIEDAPDTSVTFAASVATQAGEVGGDLAEIDLDFTFPVNGLDGGIPYWLILNVDNLGGSLGDYYRVGTRNTGTENILHDAGLDTWLIWLGQSAVTVMEGADWVDLDIVVTRVGDTFTMNFSPYHGDVPLMVGDPANLTATATSIRLIPEWYEVASERWLEILDPDGASYFEAVEVVDNPVGPAVTVTIPLHTYGTFRLRLDVLGGSPWIDLRVGCIFKSFLPLGIWNFATVYPGEPVL